MTHLLHQRGAFAAARQNARVQRLHLRYIASGRQHRAIRSQKSRALCSDLQGGGPRITSSSGSKRSRQKANRNSKEPASRGARVNHHGRPSEHQGIKELKTGSKTHLAPIDHDAVGQVARHRALLHLDLFNRGTKLPRAE